MGIDGHKKLGTLKKGCSERESSESCPKERAIKAFAKDIDRLETDHPSLTGNSKYLNISNEVLELNQRRPDNSFLHRFEIEKLRELFEDLIDLLKLEECRLLKQSSPSSKGTHLKLVGEKSVSLTSYFPKRFDAYTGGVESFKELPLEEISAKRKEVFAAALAVLMGEAPLYVNKIFQNDGGFRGAVADAVREKVEDILSETGLRGLLELISKNKPEEDVANMIFTFSNESTEDLEGKSRGLDDQDLSPTDLSIIHAVLSTRHKVSLVERGRSGISSFLHGRDIESLREYSPGEMFFWKTLEELARDPDKRRSMAKEIFSIVIPHPTG